MEEENELLTVDQFAEGFKEKYPEFKDEENSVLTERIISKYPQYKDMITFEEESNDLLSVDQFAEGFKEKYPEFKDDDNYDLTERIIAKYPQYKEQVDFQKKKSKRSYGIYFGRCFYGYYRGKWCWGRV